MIFLLSLLLLLMSSSLNASNHINENQQDKSFIKTYHSFPVIQECEPKNEEIKREARHLIRPVVWGNCMKAIREQADLQFPVSTNRTPEKDLMAHVNFIRLKKKDLQFQLYQEIYCPALNEKIVLCLKDKSPDLMGYAEAFNGVKELLLANGFGLSNDGLVTKRQVSR